MGLEHGCRSEYGPLEFRIQTTSVDNSSIIYIEDTRLTQRTVHEHQALGTIESAKTYAVLQADDYLRSFAKLTNSNNYAYAGRHNRTHGFVKDSAGNHLIYRNPFRFHLSSTRKMERELRRCFVGPEIRTRSRRRLPSSLSPQWRTKSS
jgi:hypothetical protein